MYTCVSLGQRGIAYKLFSEKVSSGSAMDGGFLSGSLKCYTANAPWRRRRTPSTTMTKDALKNQHNNTTFGRVQPELNRGRAERQPLPLVSPPSSHPLPHTKPPGVSNICRVTASNPCSRCLFPFAPITRLSPLICRLWQPPAPNGFVD